MSQKLLVLLFLISVSIAAVVKKPITVSGDSSPVSCGNFFIGGQTVHRTALEACQNEDLSSNFVIGSKKLLRFRNRPIYYKGLLFPQENGRLIMKEIQSTFYLQRQKDSRSYVVVKWDSKKRICTRVGALHKPNSSAPFERCTLQPLAYAPTNHVPTRPYGK